MAEGNGIFTLAAPRDIENLGDCYFYHTLDLPGFGTVEGEWDLRGRFDDYVGGIDLRGKTVLDVGTANGFLTFEAEKRGAKQVVSFDIGDAKFQSLLPFSRGLQFRRKMPARPGPSPAWGRGRRRGAGRLASGCVLWPGPGDALCLPGSASSPCVPRA
jgi:hypothetical protein